MENNEKNNLNENINQPEKVEANPEIKKQEKTKEITENNKDEIKNNKDLVKKQKKEEEFQRKEELKRQKLEKRQQRANQNTRWFWFFILLLLAIIGLFVWDNCRKTKFMKSQQKQIDTLENNVFFYKSKFNEKDSAMNKLLADYNQMLAQNLQNSKELDSKKQELLKLQKMIYLQDSILREVKKTIDGALAGYGSDEISVEMKDGKLYITMREKLLFASGSAVVEPKGLNALKTLAKVLKSNQNIDIMVEGHTDNVPLSPKNKLYKDNWELSTARAVEVTRILVNNLGIRPERITAAGRSMYFPVAPNTTEIGKAKNRRIEFILTPNLEELYKLLENANITK